MPNTANTMNERGQLMKRVEEAGASRWDAGTLKDEADYLAGALAVMESLGIGCPAGWFFGIMRGESQLKQGQAAKGSESERARKARGRGAVVSA